MGCDVSRNGRSVAETTLATQGAGLVLVLYYFKKPQPTAPNSSPTVKVFVKTFDGKSSLLHALADNC